MPENTPLAVHEFTTGGVGDALEFLKRTRSELRTLRRVRVWKDRFSVFDINGDTFEISGVGYESPEIVAILDAVNAAYDPKKINEPVSDPYKEFKTGRCRPWAEDRVM